MNDEYLYKIMNRHKHIINKYPDIDIERNVMQRIEQYEDKKSSRLVNWEYFISALVLISGVFSIFIIQFLFDLDMYAGFNKWLQMYISAIRWISTAVFAGMILSVICFVSFISLFKRDRETIRKHI